MLIPSCCPVCGTPGPAPCDTCASELRLAPALPSPPGVDRCAALLAYEGAGRELLARLKYRNARSALRWLAWHLARLVPPGSVDVVTWAPTSDHRRRQRGFDQAALLARAVGHELHLPCARLLYRPPGPPQTGRSLDERRRGPAFTIRPGAPVPARVLLVDDIVTTGATMAAAALALRHGGAETVVGLAAGRTPPPRTRTAADGAGMMAQGHGQG